MDSASTSLWAVDTVGQRTKNVSGMKMDFEKLSAKWVEIGFYNFELICPKLHPVKIAHGR